MSTTTRPDAGPSIYEIFRIRDFRLFVTARLTITLAVLMAEIIVQWQVYDLTKDKLALGLIGLVEAIPKLSISLWAGHIADRFPRKRVALLALSLVLLGTIGLVFIALNVETLYARFGIWPFYLVTATNGIGYGLSSPAVFALMSQIVTRELYARASAISSSSWQIGAIAGPAIGGILYGSLHAPATYSVAAVLFAIGLSSHAMIRTKGTPPPAVEESITKSLKTGISFVFKNQIILGALSLDLFAVLFGGAIALLPVYASDILHVGAEGLGVLRAAPSIGAAVAALWFAHRSFGEHVGAKLLVAVGGFGICMILFGISTSFYLSFAVLLISGALDSVSVIIRSTILQIKTPDAMRGRVSSVNMMFIGSSNELGAFESGLAAKLMGTVPSVVFGGCMTLITVIGTAIYAPMLRKMGAKDLK